MCIHACACGGVGDWSPEGTTSSSGTELYINSCEPLVGMLGTELVMAVKAAYSQSVATHPQPGSWLILFLTFLYMLLLS